VPMVKTWAWIWGPNGPRRLDWMAAVEQAMAKVAPGYSGYTTGLHWDDLHYETWVWKGDYPGKIGVGATVEAWFKLGRTGLILKRAELRVDSDDHPTTVRWPK